MIRLVSALFRPRRTTDFDGLYRRHAPSVYRYAYAVLGNHADAEDVAQQTFLNAYRAIARGTKPRKAENWLLTIAHNEVRRHFRSTNGKALEVEFDDERLAHPAPERSDPSLADVLRALQQLPPPQRAALVMREFEGRSYAEIAQILNVTQSALEGLIFRGRRALAEHLEGALICSEAEQALSRRLDGRLPRLEARRLKAHLRACPLCVRFGEVQKRQRSVLRGLSVMPIPASLFLFRGEPAAAATGLGAGAATAGGSAALGIGGSAAGAGGTGIAAGVVAKVAAATAAAAVAGGVSYGVAAGPDIAAKPERKIANAAAVEQTRRGGRAAEVAAVLDRGDQPGPARPANAHGRRKEARAKALPSNPTPSARKAEKAPKVEKTDEATPDLSRARGNSVVVLKARPPKRAAGKRTVPRARKRPAAAKKPERIKREHLKPLQPAPPEKKPPPGADPASPTGAAGRGPKNQHGQD
jgi:RNA polymerase sigma-70 factor (ECF subfamily)